MQILESASACKAGSYRQMAEARINGTVDRWLIEPEAFSWTGYALKRTVLKVLQGGVIQPLLKRLLFDLSGDPVTVTNPRSCKILQPWFW